MEPLEIRGDKPSHVYDVCLSSITLGKDKLVCELKPHNRMQDHVATVAMQLQPSQINQMRSPKWIHGKITWSD